MEREPLYILNYEHGGYVLWKDVVKPRLKKIGEWLEKYPSLRIGLDYESFTFDEFSKEDPEVVEIIRDLLRKYPDRVGLGATTYGQPLSLTISEESNARQLLYAVRTNLEYFSVTPNTYAISEFALNNQTPQLIRLCGYDAAILRSHVMGYGYPKTFASSWGKWIGKDRTAVPAVPTYDGEGRGFNCTTVDNWILSRWPDDSDLYSLEDYRKMFSEYSPLLASRYDDLTQPIERLVSEIERKEDYKYVLLEDIPVIYGEPVDEYVTTDNDFHVQMPWGYCGNEIFNGCREGEVQAVINEKLNSLSVMLGGKSEQAMSEQAWKYILAAQHHDVTICGLLDLARRFIPQSLKAADFVKSSSLSVLSKRFGDKEHESIFVFNSHSFDIDEWIEVSVKDASCAAYDHNQLLECETVTINGETKLRVHVSIPAFTAKNILIKNEFRNISSQFSYNDGRLDTPVYTMVINEKGICSLTDKKSGKKIIDNSQGELFTAWIEDEYCVSEGTWDVQLGTYFVRAVHSGSIGTVKFKFEMLFNNDSRRIDCKTEFEIHSEHIGRTDITQGRPVPLTVSGHHHEDKLCFVMNTCLDKDRRMIRDLPFSISDWNGALRKTEKYWYPDDDILIDVQVSPEESFSSATYMQGIYWIALKDSSSGVAVMNRGCMGGAVEGNRIMIPLVYANEYLCGTKMLDGIYQDEFALYSISSDESEADIHKAAMSYEYPPVAELIGCSDGDLTEFTMLDYSGDSSVILTALYPEDNFLLARFCNYSDSQASAQIKPAKGRVVCETDLLANELKVIDNNKLMFRPWEIKTVKIELI